MKTPQIKPHFRVEIVEPKTAYLLSESAIHALTGSLYCQILPLLNGQHTLEAMIQTLDGQVPPDHIDYVRVVDPQPLMTALAAIGLAGGEDGEPHRVISHNAAMKSAVQARVTRAINGDRL